MIFFLLREGKNKNMLRWVFLVMVVSGAVACGVFANAGSGCCVCVHCSEGRSRE